MDKHRASIKTEDTGDMYRVQFDAVATCTCGWTSTTYHF